MVAALTSSSFFLGAVLERFVERSSKFFTAIMSPFLPILNIFLFLFIQWTSSDLKIDLERNFYRPMNRFLLRIARSLVKQDSPFLDLPLDIMYAVMDELPLSSQILLCQTCKALWVRMRERFSLALQQMTAEERLEALTDLANLLPDHYFCSICKALHCIDHEDLPANTNRDFLNSTSPCAYEQWKKAAVSIGFGRHAFRHAHLASKYTRMDTGYQGYREKLLRKYELRGSCCGSLTAKAIIEPRIIRDRYLLMTTCTFSAGSKPYYFESLANFYVHFCPHTGFSPVYRMTLHPFGAAMQQAFKGLENGSGGRPKFFSCDRCPTDISYLVGEDETRVVSWTDLGTARSTQDPYWQSHVFSLWNNIDMGSFFEYDHGSIRELYMSRHA